MITVALVIGGLLALGCAVVVLSCCVLSSRISRMEEAMNRTTSDYVRLFDATHVDLLMWRYLLLDQTWRIGAGEVRCVDVWRSVFTNRVIATCETPRGVRVHIPARELWAAVVMITGGASLVPLDF